MQAQLQLLAQLEGATEGAGSEFNPPASMSWNAIRDVIMEALAPFPGAVEAVTNRLFAEIHGIRILSEEP